jgi:hypothetical protein
VQLAAYVPRRMLRCAQVFDEPCVRVIWQYLVHQPGYSVDTCSRRPAGRYSFGPSMWHCHRSQLRMCGGCPPQWHLRPVLIERNRRREEKGWGGSDHGGLYCETPAKSRAETLILAAPPGLLLVTAMLQLFATAWVTKALETSHSPIKPNCPFPNRFI